jgi:tetratricopeptide (TPR) repeat protein
MSAAAALAGDSLALALREEDPWHIKRARAIQIRVDYSRGALADVEKHLAAALDAFEQPGVNEGSSLVSVVALAPASFNAWVLGRAEIARNRQTQMRRAANEHNPYELAFVEMSATFFHHLLKAYEQAEQSATRSLELSEKHHFSVLTSVSKVYLGYARAQLGRATDVPLIRHGISEMHEIGTRTYPGLVNFFLYLATAQQRAGVIDDALVSIDESLQVNPDVLVYRPEALRVRGELRKCKGQPDLAASDFYDSIALARTIGAKAWELRSTMSLAGLFQDRGHRDEAHRQLSEIYNWFTEGFDTADLKEAKALLDELTA